MNKQSGSAIFIILIAVALFAALGFAFMQGGKGSTKTMTDEAAKAYAGQIIAYGNDVKSTLTRMKLRGVAATKYDFGNSVMLRNDLTIVTAVGHNPNCTAESCQVFSAQGGGLIAKKTVDGSALNTEAPGAPTAIQDGAWAPYEGSVDGIGTSQNDILYLAGYIKKDVCIKINEQLGVSNPGGIPPKLTVSVTSYSGTFAAAGTVSGGVITNHSNYCYEINARPGVYNYLATVLAR